MAAEKVRLRIGSVSRAVLVTGQSYQDPKDALNEFVSNAADEYAERDLRGSRIRVVLKRRGRYPTIAVDDSGGGMSPDRLREVARNLFKSVKAGDDRTLGEKAIGLLAFQQLGARMDVVSRTNDSDETWCLHLDRGAATARLDLERRRVRTEPGTTVYIGGVDREVLRMLTQRKVVEYLRRRRATALERGDYEIEISEGRSTELVTPERPEGVKVPLRARTTLWGPIEYALYVTAASNTQLKTSVVGRAGTTIIDDLTQLDEFDTPPWNTGQVNGRILFEALQQTAGRRAILRDNDAYPIFVDAVTSAAPAIQALIDRVTAELDRDTNDRLTDEVRRIFATVLRELDDLDNPMRTAIEGAPPSAATQATDRQPTLDELAPRQTAPPRASPTGQRSSRLPSLAVDPTPTEARSRFDPEERLVLYNDGHPDYLMAKSSEHDLLDYFATLVAKEYVVYNNPRAVPEDLAEQMVRMIVRVRRQLTKRS